MHLPFENFSKFFSDRIFESKKDKELCEKIKADLLEKLPSIKDFFGDYDPQSVVHMLENYAHTRHRFTKNAKFYTSQAEDILLEYRQDAEIFLKQIQYKKLFNLECLWRAGKTELEGIETTIDFHRWYGDVYHCPFLPPITEEEVDLMVRFLSETPVEIQQSDDNEMTYDWHNYPYLKMCYAEREKIELQEFYKTYVLALMNDNGIPPWYDFYDEHMFTQGLLALDDIKFPKEIHYRQLYYKHKEKEKKKKDKAEGKKPAPPPPPMPERLPWIGLAEESDKCIDEMVEEFETPENKRLYKCFKIVENVPEKEDVLLKEELQSIMYKLEEAQELVAIENNEDWRKGLIIAYRKYKFRKTIEAIPSVYNDYLMRLETGIGFAGPEEKGLYQYQVEIKEAIFEGMKLAGDAPGK